MTADPPQELPPELSLFIVGLVLLFWLLATIVSGLNARRRLTRHGFRNERIRALEVELRVAQGHTGQSRDEVERLKEELKEAKMRLVRRDDVINEQQSKLKSVHSDLKYSIIKTRELRAELAEKATEIVYAEARIRALESGLADAHTPADMTDAAVRDYHLTNAGEDEKQVGLIFKPGAVRVQGPKRPQ